MSYSSQVALVVHSAYFYDNCAQGTSPQITFRTGLLKKRYRNALRPRWDAMRTIFVAEVE